jgi:HAD superfamily hydrolase (TIGR01509 family)
MYNQLMIKAIIFDLGGVILLHRADLMAHILSEMFDISVEQAIYIWKERGRDIVKGQVTSGQFLLSLKKDLPTTQSLNELLHMWSDLYKKNAAIDEKMLDMVKKLKATHEVYLLTDTIDTNDAYNIKRDIYRYFTGTFRSHIENLSKAEGDMIFLHVLKKINRRPDECVFIDDNDTYVQQAIKVGIKGLLYANSEKLTTDLLSFGIQV